MTSGSDAILSRLTELQAKAPRAARAAVTEVATEFEEELRGNTPVETGDLQDAVAQSGFKGGGEGLIMKDIGYQKGWYARYPDDGTIYQSAQHFKERTINAVTPKAKQIYADAVRKGLGL